MRRFLLLTFFIPSFGLLLYSCSSGNDDLEEVVGEPPVVTLYASEAADGTYTTRTAMNDLGQITWNSTDVVCVNGATSTAIDITNNGLKAAFTVQANAPYYVLYPAYSGVTYDETAHTFAFNFPSSQPYGGNTTFADGVNPAVAVSASQELYFYNVCGVLKAQFKVQVGGVSKFRFLSAGEVVAGEATVNPEAKTMQVTGVVRSMDVAYTLPQNLSYATTVTVRWVLPVGSYASGWTVQLLDATGAVITEKVVNTGFSLTRGMVKNLGTFTYTTGGAEDVGSGNHQIMGYNPNEIDLGDGNNHEGGTTDDTTVPGGTNHEGTGTSDNGYEYGGGNNHEGGTTDDTTLPGGNNHEGTGTSDNGYEYGDDGNHEGGTTDDTTLPGGNNHEGTGTSDDGYEYGNNGNHDGVTTGNTTLPGGTNHEGTGTSENGYNYGSNGNHETVTSVPKTIEFE